MNKKILIGSVIAVCILIGVSFTSVVGYRSVTSDVKASPLFNIRSSRAIDEESGDLSCEYVGKRNIINLIIPDRDVEIEVMRKVIEDIKTMDDETFNKFVSLIFSRIKQNNIDDKKIIILFNHLRNYQDYKESLSLISWNDPCTIDAWFPGCWIINIIITIISSIHALLIWINNIKYISVILPGCCETWN